MPKLTDEKLLEKLLLAFSSEACKVVAEKVATPEAVDILLTMGLGFPAHHGGLFLFLDRLAACKSDNSLVDLQSFAKKQQIILGQNRPSTTARVFRPELPPGHLPAGSHQLAFEVPSLFGSTLLFAVGAAAAAGVAYSLR